MASPKSSTPVCVETIDTPPEVLAYRARVTPDEIRIEERIPVVCP